MLIQQPKLSPVVIICLAGAVVIIASLAIRVALNATATTVDPRVTLRQERASSASRSAPDLSASRLAAAMEGEVSRTADRIAEVTTLAFSSGVYLASASVKGAAPRDVQSLVADLARNGLLTPGLATTGSAGTFASAWGSLSVRYRPAPLGIEVISIASKPEYGPALIVRLPDETSDKGEARLYVADRLQGVIVPAPFAPAAEVIALGWSPERLRSLK